MTKRFDYAMCMTWDIYVQYNAALASDTGDAPSYYSVETADGNLMHVGLHVASNSLV